MLVSSFYSVLALLGIRSVNADSYPPVGQCSGYCHGHIHDPAVIVADGTYFRFVTVDNITIATAPSIAGPWTNRGSALPQGSKIQSPGDIWAPDISKLGSTYYLFYAVSIGGTQHSTIGVATSTSLLPGSWTDHGSVGIPTSTAYNLIDANLLAIPSSAPLLLSFGSYWTGLYQIRMADPPLRVLDSAHPVHLAQNTTKRPDNLPTDAIEGSFQFAWPVGGTMYFYLFFSSGTCCDLETLKPPPGEEYKIMACRSTEADGGFVGLDGRECLESGGKLVLGSRGDAFAPGGVGVVYDEQLRVPVIFYHYVDRTIGEGLEAYSFGWNKLDFSSGWPKIVA